MLRQKDVSHMGDYHFGKGSGIHRNPFHMEIAGNTIEVLDRFTDKDLLPLSITENGRMFVWYEYDGDVGEMTIQDNERTLLIIYQPVGVETVIERHQHGSRIHREYGETGVFPYKKRLVALHLPSQTEFHKRVDIPSAGYIIVDITHNRAFFLNSAPLDRTRLWRWIKAIDRIYD